MNKNDSNDRKLTDLYREILSDYKNVINLNPIPVNDEILNEFKTGLLAIVEKLQRLFLLVNFNYGKSYNAHNQKEPSDGFIISINDQIIEIISTIGELIEIFSQNISESMHNYLYDFYLKYSELILSFAEKSPFKCNHLPKYLNKLIDHLITSSFNLIDKSSNSYIQNLSLGKLSNEIYRALGSLVYQNGPYLNEANLNRLLFQNQSNTHSNLLDKIRCQIENDFKIKSIKNLNEEYLDLLNRLNLICAQLIFNLTIPITIKKSSILNQDENIVEYEFIEEKYKSKCASILIKILRFNYSNQMNNMFNVNKNQASYTENISKHFNHSAKYGFEDDFHFNISKILSKALQGLENLFSSIKNDQSNQKFNWLQSSSTVFQLGDILAIVKDLSFYGIQSLNNKQALFDEKFRQENKLEPTNVDELLLPLEKTKIFNDEENEVKNNKFTMENEDENKSNNCVNHKRKQNKKLNATNNSSNTSNYSKSFNTTEKINKNTKFVRNNSEKFSNQSNEQTQNQIEMTSNNSVQCLREPQVPLIQFKNNNFATDSEVSTDSSISSSSNFSIEKSNAKVRVAAIGVLLTVFQRLDKKTVIGYWDSFLGSGNFNLIYSIKNDTSPKVRLIAATALTVYLVCVRSFFTIAAADDSTNFQSSSSHNPSTSQSFLPISFTISSIIRQLHKELFVSLYQREKYHLNQIQFLKCLQSLIKATPYQKLKPGLIYKLIISLNILLEQKSSLQNDKSNLIMNEILTCLEIILNNHHQMVEVHLALLSPLNRNDSNFLKNKSASMNSSISDLSLTVDDSDLNLKLEKLTTNIKVPNLSQSRVKYFYEANNSFSLTNSNTVSGQQTPSYPISDLINDGNNQEINNKSWLVNFCVKNSFINQAQQSSLGCLEILSIICRKYFDLLQKDLFFEDICKLIIENIESQTNSSDFQLINQIRLKTLKFLEEFSRCLATNDLRQINSLDLNDCCKFWSNLLNSKLVSEYLIDEQRYLLSSSACDCLASIGAPIFELLPFQKRIFCLTNLLHLTKSQSSLIRAASIRALGVYVTFTSLKEDQNFLTDLSLCLLTLLLNDSNNLVRQKTAWSMSNLSEVLIENGDRLSNIFTDEFNLTIWLRLLDSATNSCQRESDKLKSYLVRTLGNLINYISLVNLELVKSQLDLNNVEKSITKSIEVLCSCRNVKMLKVKWNLSHAIGVSMRNFNTWSLHLNNPSWLQNFYDTLIELFTQSNNFKVRINACIALMTINLNDITMIREKCLTNSQNKDETIYLKLWSSLIDAFSKLKNENIDATNELQHKNTLTHQLCKLFTYLCKYLRVIDLSKVMSICLNELKLNSIPKNNKNTSLKNVNLTISELRSYLIDYINLIYDQIETNKQEVQIYNEALTQLNLLNSNKQTSIEEDCINLLNNILRKPSNERKSITEEPESSDTEKLSADNENDIDKQIRVEKDSEYRKKYPFKNVYD